MKKLSIQFGKEMILPKEFKTLPGMLLKTAEKFPARGIIYVDSYGEEDFVSYPELIKKARQYLCGMRKAGIKPGDNVIIEIDDPKEFFYTYWAALFGGIVSAPVTQPTSYDAGSAGFEKMQKVYGVLEEPIILVEDRKKEKYEKLKTDPYFKNLKILSAEDLQSDEMAPLCEIDPDGTAFLQFSSGSTGTPKGVVLTHTKVIATVMAICNGVTFDSSDVICTWLPHTHDMGLIGQHFVAVAKGMMKIKLTPMGFIRSPLMFLEKITRYKATSFCCPNFGFDWMIEKVPEEKLEKIDLSRMKVLFNGAEPISVNVMHDFTRKFAKAGFKPEVMYPVYGMAEAALAVSFPEFHSLPLVHKISRNKMVNEKTAYHVQPGHDRNDIMEIVNEGYPVEGIDIRIADDKGNVVEENVIGEIQIRGISVTAGYYNNPAANKATFIDGWLKTGDLGFMVDGKLVVNGRLKDIIFIRGQNYYAHDLEEIIYKIDGIQRGTAAVAGAFNSRTQKEEILAFIKNKGNMEKFLPLRREILELIHKELGIELSHVLPAKSIPKTTSGKLQRFILSQEYENGEFDAAITTIKAALAAAGEAEGRVVQPATDLEADIRKCWANVLNQKEDTISITSNFFQLGGNSVKGIQLIAALEELAHCVLDHDILISCKTIEEMARYLLDKKDTNKSVRDELLRISGFGSRQQKRSTDLLHKIAVTGMALRLPFADNKEEFWDNLVSRKKCITKVSEKRKKLSGEKDWNDWIAELPNIDMFDNDFFGIPAEEVKAMDPQLRIMMEVAYECLEDAGVAVKLDREMNIGVYSGISQNSYMDLVKKVLQEKGPDAIPQGTMVGNMGNIIAAYISHLFNFTGPAMSVDTACSSSGVALHLGVNALRSSQIKGALVMSSNLMITPTTHLLSQKAGILSHNDHCLVFDKNADGTILGEGVVVFYIEPLLIAIKEQKNIYGIIEGIGVNNDGYSLGIMAPNPKGQYEALVAAYKDAAANPADISYIEAHGTGTALGDPVEIQAMDKLFKEFQTGQPCGIGSVKSNVGHLLPTAGAAGLAKTLLCLKKRKKVPTFLSGKLDPSKDLEKSSFYVVNEVEEWQPAGDKPLKAGVSSFGFGGTNVHIVLGEYIDPAVRRDIAENTRGHIITFSAQTEKSLEMNIKETADWLRKNREINISDVCYTRNNLRQHFRYRKAFVFRDTEDLLNYFDHNTGTTVEMAGMYRKSRAPKTALVIEDMHPGKQAGLDHDFYGKQQDFKNAFDECAEIVKALPGISTDIKALCVTDRLSPAGTVQEPGMMDALLDFSFKYSMAKMWMALGLNPCCVLGKGCGELAAMVISGLITLDDGIRLVCYRDQIINKSGDPENVRKEYGQYAANIKLREERIPFISAYDPDCTKERECCIRQGMDMPEAAPDYRGIADKLEKMNCSLIVNLGLGDEFLNITGGDNDLNRRMKFQRLNITGETLDWKKVLESIGRLYINGFAPAWENVYPSTGHRMVSLPAYCFDHKSFWLDVA